MEKYAEEFEKTLAPVHQEITNTVAPEVEENIESEIPVKDSGQKTLF